VTANRNKHSTAQRSKHANTRHRLRQTPPPHNLDNRSDSPCLGCRHMIPSQSRYWQLLP
jgi:hypothetical protein